jgi:hypothetical protein
MTERTEGTLVVSSVNNSPLLEIRSSGGGSGVAGCFQVNHSIPLNRRMLLYYPTRSVHRAGGFVQTPQGLRIADELDGFHS